MNQAEFEEFKKAATALQDELQYKTARAQQIINDANEASKKLQAAKEDLKKRGEALAQREKKLKYIQLRILKILNQNNFDQALKVELEKAMAE